MAVRPADARTDGARRNLVQTFFIVILIVSAGALAWRYVTGTTIQDQSAAAQAAQRKVDLNTSPQVTPSSIASRANSQGAEYLAAQRKLDAAKPAGTANDGKEERLRLPAGAPAPQVTPGGPSGPQAAGASGSGAAAPEDEATKAINLRNQAGASKIVAFEDTTAQIGVPANAGSGANSLDAKLAQIRPNPPSSPDLGALLKTAQAATGGRPVTAGAPGSAGQRNQDWLAQQDTGDQPPLVPQPAPSSEYLLAEGSSIPIVLLGDVISDLPGRLSAMVTRDIYDSITQRTVLVPAGSKLVGSYSNDIATGQRRLLMALARMRFPSGATVRLGGMPVGDSSGASGAVANVDNHFFEMFGSSLIIGAVALAAAPSGQNTTNVTINVGSGTGSGNAVANLGAQVLADSVKRILDRNTNLKPTLSLEKGTRLVLTTTRDMVLPPTVTGAR